MGNKQAQPEKELPSVTSEAEEKDGVYRIPAGVRRVEAITNAALELCFKKKKDGCCVMYAIACCSFTDGLPSAQAAALLQCLTRPTAPYTYWFDGPELGADLIMDSTRRSLDRDDGKPFVVEVGSSHIWRAVATDLFRDKWLIPFVLVVSDPRNHKHPSDWDGSPGNILPVAAAVRIIRECNPELTLVVCQTHGPSSRETHEKRDQSVEEYCVAENLPFFSFDFDGQVLERAARLLDFCIRVRLAKAFQT